MERMTRLRARILLGLFAFIMVLYAMRLFNLQIISTDGNTDNTTYYTTVTTVRAARGDILDRNGKVLVGNRASYDLVFNHFVIKSADNRNEYLYTLLKKCEELGVEHQDHLPVTMTRPFEYTLSDYSTAWQGYYQNYMSDRSWDPDVTAPLLIEKMRTLYAIPEEWTEEEARAVIGLRYEFDLRGVTKLPSYVFISDVDSENLAAILELNTPGLMVESSTVREYHTTYGAHILGYMGAMTDAEWQENQKLGYSMDAEVGKSGFEQAFETYLHGIDGQRLDKVTKEGTIVSQQYLEGKEPVAGNNVETTIDIDLQKVAEDALAERMKELTDPNINTGGEGEGIDAQGAAVVVMKVKTGEILACASYPTFNLATMKEDWDAINSDDLKPLFNRAFGATYAPGSTYKMCTLVAAMENVDSTGTPIYSPGETIYDTGVFSHDDFPDFHPTCLFYSSSYGSHGDLTAQDALKVSCNLFFYELGYRMTIEMMDETAKGFGLGEPTGIELTEKVGWRANRESKKASYKNSADVAWNGGDRVLCAIGQSENRFTPLQLAVYTCTLANQGTRYRATFLNRVTSSDYRTLVYSNSPEVVSKMNISDTTYNTYVDGMRRVVTMIGGTAINCFGGPKDEDNTQWPSKITVCAKTGTAQHSSGGSDHGVFVCFAPMDDPQVAIAIFGEKTAHGSSMAPVAEPILKAYFEMVDASEVYTYENGLS